MEERKGEKVGWTAGFLGGLLWVPLLSIFWLFMDKAYVGILGLILFAIGVLFITKLSPWKFPDTRFYLLMLPPYIVMILALLLFAFLGWNITEVEEEFPLWSLAILLPIFTPFLVMGWRTWNSLGMRKPPEKS